MSAQPESRELIRPDHVRGSNDRIAEQAARYRFVSRVPMLCECSDPACRTIFLIELERYREARDHGYFTAPEHTVEDAAPATPEDGYWLHRPTGR